MTFCVDGCDQSFLFCICVCGRTSPSPCLAQNERGTHTRNTPTSSVVHSCAVPPSARDGRASSPFLSHARAPCTAAPPARVVSLPHHTAHTRATSWRHHPPAAGVPPPPPPRAPPVSARRGPTLRLRGPRRGRRSPSGRHEHRYRGVRHVWPVFGGEVGRSRPHSVRHQPHPPPRARGGAGGHVL